MQLQHGTLRALSTLTAATRATAVKAARTSQEVFGVDTLTLKAPPAWQVQDIAGQGRGLVASTDIQAGSLVLQEHAFAWIPSVPLRPVVCHTCYTALEPPSSHSCTACDATVAPQYCSTGCADADKPVHTALCGANLEIEEAAASDGRRHPRLAARMTMASIVPTPGVPEFVQYWEAIQALHAAAGVGTPGSKVWADDYARIQRLLAAKMEGDPAPLFNLLPLTWYQLLMGRLAANTFRMPVPGGQATTTTTTTSDTTATAATGLFLAAALLNHDCDPSLDVEFKAAPHSHQSPLIECTARRDIPAGEQLTITYIDSSLPTAERQDLLDKGYGFQCNCFMCVMPM